MIVDFTAMEYVCNMACKYCRGYFGYSTEDRRQGHAVCFSQPMWNEYLRNPVISEYAASHKSSSARQLPIEVLVEAAELTLAIVDKELPVDAIKLSGGEITIFPEIINVFLRVPSRAIQHKILSNGVLLRTSDVKRWLEYGKRLVVQVSVDGLDTIRNALRSVHQNVLMRLLKELVTISALGVPLEINTVLTNRSIGGYFELAEWAKSRLASVTLFPRPVRNIGDNRFFPTRCQVLEFNDTLQRGIARYAEVLPSAEYCVMLMDLLNGVNSRRECQVPRNVAGISLSGAINACTIGGTPSLGNLFDHPELLSQFLESGTLPASNCWQVCKLCLCEYHCPNARDAKHNERVP